MSAREADRGPHRVVWRNGTVYSSQDPFATALVTTGGEISWIGGEEAADVQCAAPGTAVVDLRGGLLAPGFVEAVFAARQQPDAELLATMASCGVAAVVVSPASPGGSAPDAGHPSGPEHEAGPVMVPMVPRSESAHVLVPGSAIDEHPFDLWCLDPADLPPGRNALGELAANGTPVAIGTSADRSDRPAPWQAVRDALRQGLSARAAFLAPTRGGWRATALPQGGALGRLEIGRAATFVWWRAERLVVQSADERRSQWSTDARAGVTPLPDLGDPASSSWEEPQCVATVIGGELGHGNLEFAGSS